MDLLRQLTQNLPKAEAMQLTEWPVMLLNSRKHSNNFPTLSLAGAFESFCMCTTAIKAPESHL